MSKSSSQNLIDPEDLISGSEKINGTRAFGYGTDVLRLWTATFDSDRNFKVEKEELDKINIKVKSFRYTIRQILGLLNNFSP
jgi:isoleucyl-tRNA synthetase